MLQLLRIAIILGFAVFIVAAVKHSRAVFRDTMRDWRIARCAARELRQLALAEYPEVFPASAYDGSLDDEAEYLSNLRSRCMSNIRQRVLSVALLTTLLGVLFSNYVLASN